MEALEVIVLAAGQGTRMRSQLAKVLHPLAGRPMLTHVLDTVRKLEPAQVHVVVGFQGSEVREALGDSAGVNWVSQEEQKGTGHAVQQALPDISEDAVVLVVYGDVPLVQSNTLRACVEAALQGDLGLVTADFADPAELGRIVRDGAGGITEIVEYADASPAQRAIHEINSGIMALPATRLRSLLGAVEPHNAQGEYYLTDIIALAVQENMTVQGLKADCAEEVKGVNDRMQLAELERCFQRSLAQKLMREGVTIADPDRLDIRGEIEVEADCFIDINVVLIGRVTMGAGVSIGPGVVITDSEIGAGVLI
ncbi:MAG: NTP transferase domain-containing protein [Gammaproteobacteria bacterium]|nr:NTP transferase domain-containing protein [Gammaproteobacteria bacterium]